MDPLRIVLAGPGRAGMSLALAATAAGHTFSAVVARDPKRGEAAAARLDAAARTIGQSLGDADLLIVAVSDSAIEELAAALAPHAGGVTAAVHVSGLVGVSALAALRAPDRPIGSFHPLQTLPTAEVGSASLAGASIAVTAPEPLRTILHDLARSLDAEPFDLADRHKAIYHAAAAAAANFPLANLAMARDLFERAGVPFEAARPLVEAIVTNAFEIGPRAALTGPVARGDVGTVEQQVRAVQEGAPEWTPAFLDMVEHLARIAGRRDEFGPLVARFRAEAGT